MSGELASERWSPAQRVESVLISILSLLDDAEPSSPANVDAAVLLRKDPDNYKARVRKDVEASQRNIPIDFIMPTQESAYHHKAEEMHNFSWSDSEAEDDFGGSDSDAEMDFDDDDDDDDEDMDAGEDSDSE